MINIYEKKNYKRLLLIPPVLFIVFLYIIFVNPTVPKGIELSGGTIIRISLEKPADIHLFEGKLKEAFRLNDLQVNTTSSPLGQKLLIQFSNEQSLEKARQLLSQAKLEVESNPANAINLSTETVLAVAPFYNTTLPAGTSAQAAVDFAEQAFNNAEQAFSNQLNGFLVSSLGLSDNAKILKDEVGAALGESFYQNAIFVSVIAFVFLSIVVFAFFREIVPAFAMLSAAVFDIAASLSMMAILNIPLTLATIPALLTIVGYSVDTDILLTTRVVKRKDKEIEERAKDAISTGLAMTSTILATLFVMLIIAYFSQISVMFELSIVLFFGLLADIVSTWLMSAPIILWYVESKHGGD